MAARLGPVGKATKARLAALDDPDVALVALALRCAALLDDPETATAALVKEYRATLAALTADAKAGSTLDDLDALDEEP